MANPYSQRSVVLNCCTTLCGPMPPRWVPSQLACPDDAELLSTFFCVQFD